MCGFWMQNSDLWTGITSLYGSQTWPFVLCMYDSVISIRITRLYGFQPSSVVLCIQNSDLMTTIACVYGSQTSLVVFYIQNIVRSIRITSACGSKTPPVVLCMQNIVICTRMTSLYGFQPSSVFFSGKTASLWPDLQVCMGPRPHLWFLHANQQLLNQNCMSLWVLELTCDFLHEKHRA